MCYFRSKKWSFPFQFLHFLNFSIILFLLGNRGAYVQYSDHVANWDNLNRNWQDGLTRKEGFVNPDGRLSLSKYLGFYASNAMDNYNTKVRNYFTAPFDGFFSFHISGDDQHKLAGLFDSETGQYEHMAGYWSARNPSLYGSEYQNTISEPIQLAKGEKYPLQWSNGEGSGGDYVRISVGYHGKTLESGTWIDQRKKSEMKQDSYVYDHQKLLLQQDAEQDYVFLTFGYDQDLIDASLGAGETHDGGAHAQFKMKWCGDNNNCFTTGTYDIDSSTFETDFRVSISIYSKLL